MEFDGLDTVDERDGVRTSVAEYSNANIQLDMGTARVSPFT